MAPLLQSICVMFEVCRVVSVLWWVWSLVVAVTDYSTQSERMACCCGVGWSVAAFAAVAFVLGPLPVVMLSRFLRLV